MGPRKSKKNVNNLSGRRRRKINTLVESPVDSISALPDSILGLILSLLPTKSAVATSTLSKRWEFVWRTVHNLDFCLDGYWNRTAEQIVEENGKFIGFVNHVLRHHDAGMLNKFRLVWTPYCIQSPAFSWIKTATRRKVRELSLSLQSYDERRRVPFDMTMPISIFSSESLRSLKLNRDICLSAATVIYFPKLENLHLDGVTFQSVEAFEIFIKGCPILNYLIIQMNSNEDGIDDFTYIISSTSLRRLELNLGCVPRELKLEASSLEHLMISDQCFYEMNFVLNNLASLVEANFDIHMDEADDILYGDKCNSLVNTVSALDRAKILTLSEYAMQVLSCATTNLRTNFKRLVKLETSTYCCYWSSLLDLIQCSNNLQVLIIHQFQKHLGDGNEVDHSNWTTPAEVPRCLSTSLKEVVFHDYNGYKDEREMIRYMLKHGSVLEVMQVSCYRHIHRENVKVLQEIRKFPRKSPACEVKLQVKG